MVLGFATSFKRTTSAFQRCKNQSERCSYGRDWVDPRVAPFGPVLVPFKRTPLASPNERRNTTLGASPKLRSRRRAAGPSRQGGRREARAAIRMVARRGHPGGRLVVVGRRRRLIGGGRLRATERGRLGRADGHPERREAADLVIGRTARVRDGGPGRGGHVVCRGRGRGRRAHGPRRVHRSSGVARPVVTARHDLRRVVASTAGGEPRGRTRDRRAPLGQGHAITGRRLAQHHPDPIAGGGASEAASGLGRRRRKGRAVRRRVVDGRNRRASARRAPRIRVGTEAARRVSIRVVRRSGRPRRSAGRTGVYGPSARPPVGFIGRARRGEEGAARLRRSSGQVRPASKVAPGARRVVDDVRSRRSNLVLVLAPPRALLLRPAAAAAAVPGARAVDAARLAAAPRGNLRRRRRDPAESPRRARGVAASPQKLPVAPAASPRPCGISPPSRPRRRRERGVSPSASRRLDYDRAGAASRFSEDRSRRCPRRPPTKRSSWRRPPSRPPRSSSKI